MICRKRLGYSKMNNEKIMEVKEIFDTARKEVLSHTKPMMRYEVMKIVDDIAEKMEKTLLECEDDRND